jgi:hypothetical protein
VDKSNAILSCKVPVRQKGGGRIFQVFFCPVTFMVVMSTCHWIQYCKSRVISHLELELEGKLYGVLAMGVHLT